MNLAIDPWIPVVKVDGTPELASLMNVMTEGARYADLSVRPHERVALMRLLICIAQAALNGPKDKDDWKEAPKKIAEEARKYLEKWNREDAFELFHPSKPFLQIAALAPIKKEKDPSEQSRKKPKAEISETFTSQGKLDISLSTGANSTLFDHEAQRVGRRSLSDDQIAVGLITYLNFSASGRIGIAQWDGIDSPGKGASFPAPSVDKLMIHTYLRGPNLLRTICLNLLSKPAVERHFGGKNSWGRPIWEEFPKGFNDEQGKANATGTYLGRLVPLSRAVRIRKLENDLLLANGLKYPLSEDGFYETSATIKVRNNKRVLLKANSNATWRELHSIAVRNAEGNANARGPLALENLGDEGFDIWCGGVEWTTKGGYLNSVESVYSVSSRLLLEDCRKMYENEVSYAEHISVNLGWALEEYRKNIDGYWTTRSDPKKNTNAFQEKDILHAKATRSYWTAIEKQRGLLMAYVDVFDTEKSDEPKQAWRAAIHSAARSAYSASCGQETPRQIRAFALGWKKLFMEKKPETDEPTNEGDEA